MNQRYAMITYNTPRPILLYLHGIEKGTMDVADKFTSTLINYKNKTKLKKLRLKFRFFIAPKDQMENKLDFFFICLSLLSPFKI